MSEEAFGKLRTVLARLYPDAESAKVVVRGAGLNEQRISFSGTAGTTWDSILTRAENEYGMEDLLKIVEEEFPRNLELRHAVKEYREYRRQGRDLPVPNSSTQRASSQQPEKSYRGGNDIHKWGIKTNSGHFGGKLGTKTSRSTSDSRETTRQSGTFTSPTRFTSEPAKLIEKAKKQIEQLGILNEFMETLDRLSGYYGLPQLSTELEHFKTSIASYKNGGPGADYKLGLERILRIVQNQQKNNFYREWPEEYRIQDETAEVALKMLVRAMSSGKSQIGTLRTSFGRLENRMSQHLKIYAELNEDEQKLVDDLANSLEEHRSKIESLTGEIQNNQDWVRFGIRQTISILRDDINNLDSMQKEQQYAEPLAS